MKYLTTTLPDDDCGTKTGKVLPQLFVVITTVFDGTIALGTP